MEPLESTDLCDYCNHIDTCQLFPTLNRPIEEFSTASNGNCFFKRNDKAKQLGILKILQSPYRHPTWVRTILFPLNVVLQLYCSNCGFFIWGYRKCLCPACGHYEDDGLY